MERRLASAGWSICPRLRWVGGWTISEAGTSSKTYLVPGNRGAVLGVLFRQSSMGTDNYVESISDSAAERIALSRGASLCTDYWGRYVAFVHHSEPQLTWVVRDPLGGMNCLSVDLPPVRYYFSDIADFDCLGLVRLRIDWNFVAAHLVKMRQHAAGTGLSQVRELVGGHRECAQSALDSDGLVSCGTPCTSQKPRRPKTRSRRLMSCAEL